jgi:hypothetical protein
VSDWGEHIQQTRREANELHDQAMPLGYNASCNIDGELSQPPNVSFWVRRVDQPAGTEETFTTVDAVRKHLEHLATLPRYCLELEDNPQIEVVTDADGTATWITDNETGEKFGIRTADLENTTRLCMHAENPPTIGNWSRGWTQQC